jgi:tetratricopeptide (TPR) repeat protein
MSNINKNNRPKIIISIGLILIIGSAAFLPCLNNNFVNWDDSEYVTANTAIQNLSLGSIKHIFTSFTYGNYQPLTIISFSLEYHLFKVNPFIYHLTNLILHLINCLLAFWLVFILSRKIIVSSITTILFCIHPLRVESVAWTSARKDVLYVLFFLAAIISYCYYLSNNKPAKYYFLSLILFIFSLLSKAMAITLPLVMLLVDYLLDGKPRKIMGIDKIPFFILSFIFGILAVLGQYSLGAVRPENQFNILYKLMIASYCIIFYLNKILLPFRLSCLYAYPRMTNYPLNSVYLYCLLIFGIMITGVVLSGRHTKKFIFGSGIFMVTILPVLQFLPISQTIVADRYTYLPLLGIFYVVAEGFVWLYFKKIKYAGVMRILLFMILVGTVSCLALLTHKRCGVWRDSISLWSDCLKSYPDSETAYKNRGEAYASQGDFDKAIFDFSRAIRIDPNDPTLLVNLGNAYASKSDFALAFNSYNKALQIAPQNSVAYYNRAVAYFLRKEYDNAWFDVYNTQKSRGKVNPEFLRALKNASGRDR